MEKYTFSTDELRLLESMPQALAVYQFIDKRVVTLAVSKGFCRLFGRGTLEQAYYDMDHDMYKYDHPDDVARIAEAAVQFATEDVPYDVVYRTQNKAGTGYMIVHAQGEHVFTETGERLAYIWYTDEGMYREGWSDQGDILIRSMSNALHEESLLRANHYDYLTGLPNMTWFFELGEEGKRRIMEAGGTAVFLFIDISGMKFFNHKYGFAQGDRFLTQFAGVLAEVFSSESCGRLGQDHFGAFTTEEGLEDKFHQLFRETEKLNDGDSLPVRVGIYTTASRDLQASAACDRAKLACDAIRGGYESRYNYYDDELREEMVRRQYVLSNYDKALSEHWIQVYNQPIVRAVNGRVCDEEALARWVDPTEGMLSPGEFIPVLEDAGLLYKLDLYVVEQVLAKIRTLEEAGLYVVPQSVNLSRSDFDACDIVEEIRKRVDEAGVPREKITIEITESTVGSDFEFMKERIQEFQSLGFPVWMDDFGSGYSSLDVLQSIKFDLIKFDMNFMRKLHEGEDGKVILTELMIMATALGMDTVCEGVETEEQKRFLQEIGCAKLQGFYYCKPIPTEKILERYQKGEQIGFENPAEAPYYDIMGRVNLYDLAVIGSKEEEGFQNFFDVLPMGIIEVKGDETRFVRSNESYREFVRRFLGFNLSREGTEFVKYDASFMYNVVKTCCEQGHRAFYDEKMPDGTVIHSFARRISTNPVDGSIAVVIAVLSITDADEGATYAEIARALAADYYNIYYVDLETEKFIEYTSPVGGQEMAMERHGDDFFALARKDAMTRIYEEDREPFLQIFTKENIVRTMAKQGAFTASYRLIDIGVPLQATMKITPLDQSGKRIIMGVSVRNDR